MYAQAERYRRIFLYEDIISEYFKCLQVELGLRLGLGIRGYLVLEGTFLPTIDEEKI